MNKAGDSRLKSLLHKKTLRLRVSAVNIFTFFAPLRLELMNRFDFRYAVDNT